VTRKDEGEEEGEEEEEKDEGKPSGGTSLLLEPMGNMGMPTYLKLSVGASQQSNLATIANTFSIITEVIKTTRSDDLPIDTLWDLQVGIHMVEFGCALLLFNWADLPNDIHPLASGSLARVKDTFSYCFRDAPTEVIIPPIPVIPVVTVPPSSTWELSVHLIELCRSRSPSQWPRVHHT
jgi:hypothetical protein